MGMRTDVSRRRLLAGGSLGVLGSLAGCLATGRSATETVTETYGIDGVDALSLIAENGTVTVEGNQGEEIEVQGHKAAPTEDTLESLTLESKRSDDRLTVETASEDVPFLIGPDPKLDLEATVPAEVGVIRGETTNGDVTVRDATGEVVAETTNGDIDIEGVDGDLTSENTNGSITVSEVSGDVRAETTNGDIDVTLAADGGDLTAETTNDSITVRTPPSIDATVTASATNGEVSFEGFDGVTANDGDDATVTLGDGGRRLRLETTNGSVTVQREADD
ncbi:hypothetical protein Natpe_3052 [Natrinema pellirubrum DSM 15624]|uniref:DUF4097 domain-containing protein n=2 Tax=Natrinema pellirubrum (strain DSM 15624 / CIP 106293 / JCM 10476 / NCIMB 786 / 157) TaxID=797303 RepID=L0JMV9_NATP1|nr:DUF4097 family beta strand repeat-containing protein [Natrinema pellirubrum]AGB32845.1 hypothetical protein Natpe_3052 [Natrinema pellirubrum DSM 15624]